MKSLVEFRNPQESYPPHISHLYIFFYLDLYSAHRNSRVASSPINFNLIEYSN